jgi:hypothetical protein
MKGKKNIANTAENNTGTNLLLKYFTIFRSLEMLCTALCIQVRWILKYNVYEIVDISRLKSKSFNDMEKYAKQNYYLHNKCMPEYFW